MSALVRSTLALFDVLESDLEERMSRGGHLAGQRGKYNPECCEDCAEIVERDALLDAQERR